MTSQRSPGYPGQGGDRNRQSPGFAASPQSDGSVIAVCRSSEHGFSKYPRDSIRLLTGIGVEDDAHSGHTVRHRSRVAVDPDQPNLRQVHLLDRELLDSLREKGFDLPPGGLGENITTAGIDLIGLPLQTRLVIAESVELEITGLRNPCRQINDYRPGLLAEVAPRDDQGRIVRLCGIMAIIITGGIIFPTEPIAVRLPPPPHQPLRRV